MVKMFTKEESVTYTAEEQQQLSDEQFEQALSVNFRKLSKDPSLKTIQQILEYSSKLRQKN